MSLDASSLEKIRAALDLDPIKVIQEYQGKYLDYEDLLIAVTEMQMLGQSLSAYELVNQKVHELEGELQFPWDFHPHYRRLLVLRDRFEDARRSAARADALGQSMASMFREKMNEQSFARRILPVEQVP